MTNNRIDARFAQCKASGKKALIPFITAGDGGYACTEQAVMEMVNEGADLIELGIPFSDPIAEGPVIQHASERALKQGATMAQAFDLVDRLRKQTDIPLLFMMYLNTIFCYGTDKFFATCQEHGIDGVIVPDIPYEEKDEIQGSADKYNIHNISLVTPASEDRIQKIASEATGFLYCVSSNGVTGVRQKYTTNFSEFFDKIYKYAKVPCAIGFGISGPEAAKEMSQYCDGVIIGSAVVRMVEQYGPEKAPKEIGKFIKSVREALDA